MKPSNLPEWPGANLLLTTIKDGLVEGRHRPDFEARFLHRCTAASLCSFYVPVLLSSSNRAPAPQQTGEPTAKADQQSLQSPHRDIPSTSSTALQSFPTVELSVDPQKLQSSRLPRKPVEKIIPACALTTNNRLSFLPLCNATRSRTFAHCAAKL